MISIKSSAELKLMEESGSILSDILTKIAATVQPGVATIELDQLARRLFKESGGEPTFLGFHGYPASICVSINDEVVHGIPGPRVIKHGDVVGIDVGLRYKGFCTDTATTLAVGKPDQKIAQLLRTTRESLMAGIEAAVIGNRIGDISYAVQQVIESQRFGIVRDLTGHGIGREQWEEPPIPNFGRPNTGPALKAGMAIAIEPMVTIGKGAVEQLADGWTIRTLDRSIAAHFEHTVAITEKGPQILTLGLDQ